MSNSIFPHRYYCRDNGSYVHSPAVAQQIWYRVRPKGLVWYAVDMMLLSEDQVRLFVYNMANSVHGGLGQVIHTCDVSDLTDSEKTCINDLIDQLKWNAAESELQRRETEQRHARVRELLAEMFPKVSK